jgi:hypothetical protein
MKKQVHISKLSNESVKSFSTKHEVCDLVAENVSPQVSYNSIGISRTGLSKQVETANECKEHLESCLLWMRGNDQNNNENSGKTVMNLNLSINHLGFSLNSLNKFIEEKK